MKLREPKFVVPSVWSTQVSAAAVTVVVIGADVLGTAVLSNAVGAIAGLLHAARPTLAPATVDASRTKRRCREVVERSEPGLTNRRITDRVWQWQPQKCQPAVFLWVSRY